MGLLQIDNLLISDVGRIQGYLKEHQLRVGKFQEALQPPFNINFPYEVALIDKEDNTVGVISGGYRDLMEVSK